VLPPQEKISEKTSKGRPKDILTWVDKILKGRPKEIFWTKFRSVSQKCFLWSPLWDFNRISAKIFKKLWILLKKKFKQNFGDFAKNCPLNPMSLTPPWNLKIFQVSPSLAWGSLGIHVYN
jgi:hypothetical protein